MVKAILKSPSNSAGTEQPIYEQIVEEIRNLESLQSRNSLQIHVLKFLRVNLHPLQKFSSVPWYFQWSSHPGPKLLGHHEPHPLSHDAPRYDCLTHVTRTILETGQRSANPAFSVSRHNIYSCSISFCPKLLKGIYKEIHTDVRWLWARLC